MKADAAFLDSGIFIAFLDRSDRFYAAAIELFSNPPRRCHTWLAVVAETYGWFLHRLGEKAARHPERGLTRDLRCPGPSHALPITA